MTYSHPELEGSRQHDRVQKPADAATLILVRRDGGSPRVLMGQRHRSHAFMPNKYVFPGGRLDAADCRAAFARDLEEATLSKLSQRMRGRASIRKARGLALAAVRETFEEAGLLIGRRTPEELPDLSQLIFFMRAITPPGRTRRFDSRFFVAPAEVVGNLDQPIRNGSEELAEIRWVSLDEAFALDLPLITIDVLKRLKTHLDAGNLPSPGCPVSFQYQQGRTWRDEVL
ncbi:MAG: NUDIX hydrolase [Rhizobiales bacterium]|nr:NUDIX hydrolase [Hyphomicrobiales bacterium]